MNHQGLHSIEGLQFMPVRSNKMPIVKGWQTSAEKHSLENCEAVGLVCGKLSGGLEVIDVDEKYSIDKQLFAEFKKAIHRADPTLLEKLVVAQTKNGGYHMMYRCSEIAGNMKFANRPTTDEEKKKTFDETYQAELAASKTDEQAKKTAEKASKADKVRVLLESRGEGGFVVCHPTPGYEFIYKDIYCLSEITPEERETLLTTARSFNTYFEEVVPPSRSMPKQKTDGLSPFEDYNERGDVVALLQEYGWRFVKKQGHKSLMLRPGQTSAATSGNYDESNGWFSVFTTSTEFDPQKGYRPYAVFAKLKCNDDWSEASKQLRQLGYGSTEEKTKKDYQSTRVIQSRVDPNSNDLSFLATPNDYDEYLQQVIDGTLPMGLTTGSPELDKYFLFKRAALNMTNGHMNVGKSVFVWFLLLLSAMYHGWKGIIFSSENSLGSFMRKMIEMYWGKPIQKMSEREYKTAKQFIQKHFKLIRAQEDLYNYKDIINMVKAARKEYYFDFGMVDPYNSLKIDLSGFSKLSTHEYHYEALSEFKAYGLQTDFSWWINHHAVTVALRAKDSEKKYPVAPQVADTEGGGKSGNKSDQFLTIHRITQHPINWKITEVHVRKVKEIETGGRPTPFDEPVRFEMSPNRASFIEVLGENHYGIDPIAEWHKKNTDGYKQQEMPFSPSWKNYVDNEKPDEPEEDEALF